MAVEYLRQNWSQLSADDLLGLLRAHGVSAAKWGRGPAKTAGNLLAELRDNDCELFVDDLGLARGVRHVWIDVFADLGGTRRHLVERRQVFSDGRIRQRSLPASLGEKCKIGEDPWVAARRGIAEELGITAAIDMTGAQPRENPVGRQSYPGLRTVYRTYWFITELAPADYNAEGYVEVQTDKRTYFEWEF